VSAAPLMMASAVSSALGEPSTVASVLTDATARLAAAQIEEPRREARLLLAAVLGVDTGAILGHPDRLVAAAEGAHFASLVARRAAREPAARLIGHREFWSLDFALSPETLVPRPDSETVVEAALAHIADRRSALRLLDMGTGSGCLLAALLSELPAATGIGVDIAAGAIATARRNAASLGLAERAAFFVGAWGESMVGAFDVIVANPPYIVGAAIAGLAPEVARHEPRAALDGGVDGLDAYRALAPQTARLLGVGGFAAFELGSGRGAAVAAVMRRAGLAVGEVRRDLAGIERCLILRRG
jgi:release factor glutamine methyltransferase